MKVTVLDEINDVKHSSYQTTIGSVGLWSAFLLYKNAKSDIRNKGTCKLESFSLSLMIMFHDLSGQCVSWIRRTGQECRSESQRVNMQKTNYKDLFAGTNRFWRNSVN